MPDISLHFKIILVLCNEYSKIIKIIRPKICITPQFSNVEALAFILACKKYNVATMDIQHGRQTNYHPAYTNWTNIPLGGYKMLPDVFLVWSNKEASMIRESNNKKDQHYPIVIGNVWLNKFLQENEFSRYYDKIINLALKKKAKRKINVLYTAQNSSLPDFIYKAMRLDDDLLWWIRLHPRFLKIGVEIKSNINRIGVDNCIIDLCQELPLPALLRNIDVHVTLNSTVVEDALKFGIRSVGIHSIIMKTFEMEFNQGDVILANNEAELLVGVYEQYGKYKNAVKNETGNYNGAIDQLLSFFT